MGTTLTGTRISDTYDSLLKATDNGIITSSAKQITDGVGNNTPLYISTSRIGIGVSPTTAFQVSGNSKIGGDLTVTGNLLVEGTTTTVDTDTLSVKDPLIIVGNDNNTSDLVDLGFYGLYDTSGSQDLYAGLYRSASTTKFHLFKDLQEEPTTTVNTSGTGYTKADLVIGDLEAERGTFTDSIFVSPSLYVSDAILHTGDIDTKLEFLSDQIKFSTGGSFRLSINNSYSEFFTNVRFEDGIKAQFGDNQDLEIYHDGSNSYITDTGTGDLRIQGSNQIRLSTANGNENYFVGIDNAQVELFYAGSKKFETMSTGVHITGVVISDGLDLGDNDKIRLGDSQDLEIYHDGTTGYIVNTRPSGDLYFRNETGSMVFQIQDSGTYASYIILKSTGGIQIDEDTKFTDNVKASFGDSNDLEIYHDGTNASFISNTNTTLPLQIFTDDLDIKSYSLQNNMIIANSGGAVQLYYGGSLKLSTSSTGIQVLGDLTATNGVHLADNVKASFGGSDDLEIYHNGSHAYLTNDTGNFEITTTGNLILQNASSNKWMMTNQGGGVLLYYNGGTSKLTTTPTGISINGRISGLTDPTLAQDAATKAYVDTIFASSDTLAEVLSFGNETLGNSIIITTEDDVFFRDNSMAIFGNANDLSIYHDSSNSHIRNATGDLLISALEADSNIKFYTDNGTGTTVSNLEISGSTGTVSLKYYGSQKLYTTSTGVSITGRISQLTDPSAAQDAATKSYVDSQVGNNNELSEVLANGNTTGGTDIAVSAGDDITFTDTSKILMGAGNDLQIYHDGTNSYIDNSGTGGALYIQNQVDDADIIFRSDDGSGGLANYIQIDGGSLQTKFFKQTEHQDNVIGGYGNGMDLQLFHNATDSFIDNYTGNLNFRSFATDGDMIFKSDDGSGGTATYYYLDGSEQLNRFQKGILIPDNVHLSLGNSFDLKIYHDGANSYISNETNSLIIQNNSDDKQIIIKSDNGSGGIADYFRANGITGEAILYHYGSSKLATTSTGVSVTGAINADNYINIEGGTNPYLRIQDTTNEEYLNLYSSDNESAIVYTQDTFKISSGVDFLNQTPRLTIDSSGNVGIGTDSPDAALEVNSGGGIHLSDNTAGRTLIIKPSLTGAVHEFTSDNTIAGYSFSNNSSEFMRISSNGNVGIGTSSPTTALTIRKAISPTAYGEQASMIEFKSYYTGYDTETVKSAIYSGVSSQTTLQTTRGFMSFWTADFVSGGGQSLTEKMRIESNGNLGIGTTSPAEKLHVQGNLRLFSGGYPYIDIGVATNNYFRLIHDNPTDTFKIQKNGGTLITVAGGGNVGIGTTSPTSYYSGADNLVVKQDSGEGGMSIVTANDTTGAIYFADGTSGNEQYRGGIGYTHSTDKLFLVSGGQTRVWMNDSGNVGIGTDSPDAKLQVQGTNSGVLIDTSTAYTPLIKASGALSDLKLSSVGNGGNLVLEADCTTASIIQFNNGGSERMRITSGGLIQASAGGGGFRVVSDAANPSNLIEYYYSSSFNHGLEVEGDRGLKMYSNTGDNSGKLTFYTEGSEKMRITSGGVIQNNSLTTTQSSAVRFSNDGFTWGMIIEDDQVNNGLILFSAQNGDSVGSITRSGLSTSFNTVSDYRLKEDLQDFAGLDMVSKIPVYDFKWKSEESRSYGVMAHELQEVLPDAVTGKKDAKEMQGVDYSKIVPLLVKSIQELKAEIELLKTQINN